MNLTFSKRWLLLPGVILLIVGGLVAHVLEGADISYPTNVWRMDLDDMLANIGTVLLGIGTLLLGFAALIKAREALSISKRNEHSINGGMGDIAREHVNGALENADVEQGLWKRVDVIEQSNKDCLEREARMKELMQDVYVRLDATGLGREEDRDGN